ncbi:helicase associated domain-containing protein [Synechococcus sp. CC9605]|uniref:helicase associated domain-containing protein n=1 Tax=Synechococcus sp. (strain CC9605) TaxID=110662 RepID=UPI0018DC772A
MASDNGSTSICPATPAAAVTRFPLGNWVNTQRREYAKKNQGHLSPERIKQLNDFYFLWKIL